MSKKIKPVRLEDLAKELKVSKVTVSKALRGHSDISDETISRVKKLADKLGYTPNFMAKRLSSRKSNIIGVVVPKIAHFFFASVIESIYDTALENDYEIILTVSQESAEREAKHIQSLLSMNIDGLIISVTEETKDVGIFKQILSRKIPLVFIDRVPDIKGVSSVTVDDENGAFNAVEYLVSKGYTKIGHIGGFRSINIGEARYNGFMRALKKHKIPVNKNWITEGGFGEESGYEGFNKIFARGSLPEAFLAVTYPAALGLYEAAVEKGISIPEDIKVVCFGNNSFRHLVPSVFNFVDQPTVELGKESVNLLIKMIQDPSEKPVNIELETRLIYQNGFVKGKLVV